MNEDIVCVEVLPEQDWTCPSSIVIDEEIKEEEAEESTAKQVCRYFSTAMTIGCTSRFVERYRITACMRIVKPSF